LTETNKTRFAQTAFVSCCQLYRTGNPPAKLMAVLPETCLSDEALKMIVTGDVKNKILSEPKASFILFSPQGVSFSRRDTALTFWFVFGQAKMNEVKQRQLCGSSI